MKNFFILISIFFLNLPGMVSAQEYPEKLIGENFTTLQKFRGIYTKIYKDNPSLTEVCKRTLQWPEFWEKTMSGDNVSAYSVLNCENLNSQSELSKFLNLAKKNIHNFNLFKDAFIERFQLELNLLEMENDLRRETGLAYIFSDGRNQSHNSAEGINSDSPFDLVSDLNEIDEIFFGEKSEKPDFTFANQTKREIFAEIPTADDNEDYWLTQTTEYLPEKSENFNNYQDNLSGGLWRIGIKIFREKLNTHPLWLNYIGKTALDAIATDGVFSSPGFDTNLNSQPNSSEDSAEALELSYNPLPNLNAYITKYILAESLFKTQANEGTINKIDQVSDVLKQKEIQKQIIREKLQYFERQNSRNSEVHSAHRNILNLQKFNEYLNLFREKLRFLRKKVFPDFLNKPQHSS